MISLEAGGPTQTSSSHFAAANKDPLSLLEDDSHSTHHEERDEKPAISPRFRHQLIRGTRPGGSEIFNIMYNEGITVRLPTIKKVFGGSVLDFYNGFPVPRHCITTSVHYRLSTVTSTSRQTTHSIRP